MSLRAHQHRMPPVYVIEADHERLTNLAETSDTRGARLLAEEMERAVVIADESEAPKPFARLHARVAFTDLMSGRTRIVELVPPDTADIDQGRLSVLTPVGAALIGLPRGESIGVRTEDGRARVLIVDDVEEKREAS